MGGERRWTVFGERKPGVSLPFELPRSMAQVADQLQDVPDDIKDLLFPRGYDKRFR